MKFPIQWGAIDPHIRGPIIADESAVDLRNIIGSHTGHLCTYRGLAFAKGFYDPKKTYDLSNTEPSDVIGPFPTWYGSSIVSLDPFGASVVLDFSDLIRDGINLRPTISITRGRLCIPEIVQAYNNRTLFTDNKVLLDDGCIQATKIAIDPVWYLPGVAQRFSISETILRESLYYCSGGMYEELLSCQEKKVFLPPIGNYSVYIFGNITKLGSQVPVTLRIHDECIGSDVFGSTICTCRTYLVYGIEESIKCAQEGGIGIIVYGRKEGRSLGEVIKYMVYNSRMRQNMDLPSEYFLRTERVAGVSDIRFQELTSEVLLWLGVTKISNLISMSESKLQSINKVGIKVEKQLPLPYSRIPRDAHVEITAKKNLNSSSHHCYD